MKKTVLRFILVLMFILMLSGALGVHKTPAMAENWLLGWENRIKLTIDHTKIGSSLLNFPILVHLNSASGTNRADVSAIFDTLGNNSKKIVITTSDSTTQCYVEIEKWDSAAKEAWLWVNVPTLSNTADTVLFFYYDKHQVDNSEMVGDTGSVPAQNVWDNNFVAVYHFGQQGNGRPGEYKDSTSHHNDGQGGSGLGFSTPTLTTANTKTGYAQSFNGDGNFISIPDSDGLSVNTTGALTISVWISPADLQLNKEIADGYIRWMGKGDTGQAEYNFVMYSYDGLGGDGNSRSQWISFYVYSPSGNMGAGGGGPHGYLAPNAWMFFTGSTDSINTYGYFNGVKSPGHDSWSAFDIQYAKGTDPLRIGTDYMDSGDWWNGRLGEMRISNVSRSDVWIQVDYYSENDQLISFGVPGNPPVISPIGDKSVSAGEVLTFSVSASTPNDSPLTYSASNLPLGANFDSASQTFSWIPNDDQIGTYPGIHFEVTDGTQIGSVDITITVNAAVTGAIQIPSVSGLPTETPSGKWGVFSIVIVTCVLIAVIAAIVVIRWRRWRTI